MYFKSDEKRINISKIVHFENDMQINTDNMHKNIAII